MNAGIFMYSFVCVCVCVCVCAYYSLGRILNFAILV
jgi:hypothetical protein